MAVNQAQANPTPPSVPADDTDVKLQKLQDDVDLIKVSIKRLLIDIRERMNERENPFISVISSGSSIQGWEKGDAAREVAPARKASEAVSNNGGDSQSVYAETFGQLPPNQYNNAGTTQNTLTNPQLGPGPDSIPEDRLIEGRRSQVIAKASVTGEISKQGQEKLRLTKVHRLFEWTSRMVKKYGNDRLEMMLRSYRAMGYISKDSGEQVKEIAHLIPASIGESHDIGPDEFIKELYTLNRILDPTDMSLDRDMIEVLMEQHRRSAAPANDTNSVGKECKEDWVRMLDGV